MDFLWFLWYLKLYTYDAIWSDSNTDLFTYIQCVTIHDKDSLLGEQRRGDKEPYLKWDTGRNQGNFKRLEDIYPTNREWYKMYPRKNKTTWPKAQRHETFCFFKINIADAYSTKAENGKTYRDIGSKVYVLELHK